MAISFEGKEEIGIDEMGEALKSPVDAIASISPAKVGDKTLIDTLIPGCGGNIMLPHSGNHCRWCEAGN